MTLGWTCSLKLSHRSGLTLGWPDKHMAVSLGHIRSGRRGGEAGLARRCSPVPFKSNAAGRKLLTQHVARPSERLDARLNTEAGARLEKRLNARLEKKKEKEKEKEKKRKKRKRKKKKKKEEIR